MSDQAQLAPLLARPSAARMQREHGTARFLRSASVRLAGVYAVLFGASALALILFLWWATAGLLERQVDAAIRADAQGLAERWQDGGLVALVGTVRERIAENIDDDALYLLTDSRGSTVAGNLAGWPAAVTEPDLPYDIRISRGGVQEIAHVHRFDLPGGYHLLVGRDVRTRSQLRALLTDALVWAVVVVIALATVGAFLVRGFFQRMLADVSATTTAIAAGDLSQRVRVSGRGDEFDHLAETINDMLDRIARLMDGVRQVSNAIAHDLRTPITRARTRLEDAALHSTTAADLRAAVDRGVADLDAITSVFQALLRIAEIEAGSRRSAFAPLDLGPLLNDLAELYGAVAEERGLTLTLEISGRLGLRGDRDMLQLAVANLLDNALKFSPAGGTVTLRAVGPSDGRASDGQTGPRIEVIDQGQGIPSADRERAVERFYRGEQARHTPGSGLGLAQVQAVATLHGATLTLDDADPTSPTPGLRATLALARGLSSAMAGSNEEGFIQAPQER